MLSFSSVHLLWMAADDRFTCWSINRSISIPHSVSTFQLRGTHQVVTLIIIINII